MLHFCVFGGNEGEIEPGRHLYFTAFGASELRRPTLARLVRYTRRADAPAPKSTSAFFLTIFGGLEVKSPPLAEEFSELESAVRSGDVSIHDVDRVLAAEALELRTSKLTLFGGADTSAIPTEDEELDGLAILKHTGAINGAAEQVLMMGIGRTGAQRLAIIRQAVQAVHGAG